MGRSAIGKIANTRYLSTMLNVTLRRFQVFIAIVEKGTFAAAANHLDIAQPSISAHIAALEKQVGGIVFARKRGRKPVLTELGEGVLLHARELLAEADELSANVMSLRTREGQKVVFSCQRSLANYVLKNHITKFALLHPEVHLVLRIGTQEEVVGEIRGGTADVGCFMSGENPRGLSSEVIGRERLLLVAAPNHPLISKSKVTAAQIEKHGFVGAATASLFGRAVSKLMAGVGIRNVTFVAQVTEYQFLRELVAAGVGIACSPESSVRNDIERGILAQIWFDGPELQLDIRQAASIQRGYNEGAAALLAFLRKANPSAIKEPG